MNAFHDNRRVECSQFLHHVLNASCVSFVVASDSAYNPVTEVSAFRLVTDKLLHVVSLVGAYESCLDGFSSGWLFLDRNHLQVTVKCHGEASRNGRRAHHEHVGIFAFREQGLALVYAKAVLLVDNHESEFCESNVLGKQGMCSDDGLAKPHLQFAQNLTLFGGGSCPDQQLNAHSGRFEERLHLLKMLSSQNIGRYHQGALFAGTAHG